MRLYKWIEWVMQFSRAKTSGYVVQMTSLRCCEKPTTKPSTHTHTHTKNDRQQLCFRHVFNRELFVSFSHIIFDLHSVGIGYIHISACRCRCRRWQRTKHLHLCNWIRIRNLFFLAKAIMFVLFAKLLTNKTHSIISHVAISTWFISHRFPLLLTQKTARKHYHFQLLS